MSPKYTNKTEYVSYYLDLHCVIYKHYVLNSLYVMRKLYVKRGIYSFTPTFRGGDSLFVIRPIKGCRVGVCDFYKEMGFKTTSLRDNFPMTILFAEVLL